MRAPQHTLHRAGVLAEARDWISATTALTPAQGQPKWAASIDDADTYLELMLCEAGGISRRVLRDVIKDANAEAGATAYAITSIAAECERRMLLERIDAALEGAP